MNFQPQSGGDICSSQHPKALSTSGAEYLVSHRWCSINLFVKSYKYHRRSAAFHHNFNLKNLGLHSLGSFGMSFQKSIELTL